MTRTLRYRTYRGFHRAMCRLKAEGRYRVVHWYATDHEYVIVTSPYLTTGKET